MNRKFSVYGIGNALIDLQLRATDEDLDKFELRKAGMTLAESSEQEKILAEFSDQDLNRASGGSGANTVIAMAQLLSSVAYGCLVGEDELGAFYDKDMQRLGVAVDTPRLPDEQTGTCVILITPDAERTMVTHLGASAKFDAAHVSEDFIKDSEWLYIEGYLFSTPSGQAAVRRAIALAKENDVKIAITFSDMFIVESFREPLEQAVASADLVFANLLEAQAFADQDNAEAAYAALKRSAPNVVMTMSEHGALVHYQGQDHQLEAYSVEAIDDTGAGDMFAGGFLYGITNGLDGRGAGQLACFLASKVVSQLGPRLDGDVRGLAEAASLL